ncbi:hypothetical protein [Cellulomonas endometrii]|uniref:hypothetical protein n=1 Tax=Cellulomonas endometrii TaxID=3036301 RepID=UPI0024AE4CD4|nr:hypothetical protein [Cellulomonas endometrii]
MADRRTRSTRWRWVGGGAVLVAGAALVLSRCGADPVLLDESDFTGVTATSHRDWIGVTPGPTWCDGIGSEQFTKGASPGSALGFGERGAAGATIIDRSSYGAPAEYILELLERGATSCAESEPTTRGYSIEPLTGLAEGEVGWTTRTSDGEWGEYVLIPLDEWRLLAVGFSTSEDEPPVEMDELIERAREGAEQFPPERG